MGRKEVFNIIWWVLFINPRAREVTSHTPLYIPFLGTLVWLRTIFAMSESIALRLRCRNFNLGTVPDHSSVNFVLAFALMAPEGIHLVFVWKGAFICYVKSVCKHVCNGGWDYSQWKHTRGIKCRPAIAPLGLLHLSAMDMFFWTRLGSYVISSVRLSVCLSVTKVLILPAIRFFWFFASS